VCKQETYIKKGLLFRRLFLGSPSPFWFLGGCKFWQACVIIAIIAKTRSLVMVDAVGSNVLKGSPGESYVVCLTGFSDGTGETNVAKVDISGLKMSDGQVPGIVNITEVEWSIQGYSAIKFSWDHTTDDVALYLAKGNGFLDFGEEFLELRDPASAGDTGDLLLSSVGAVVNGTYTITLTLNLRKG
jgi:hypothetical protein